MRDLEVFAQAIEIEDEDKRAKYVLAACGSDSALRAEVMRLLDSYSRADSLLETQPVGDQFADQLLGQFESSTQGLGGVASDLGGHDPNIGPYRLLEKLGEGGFGEVFVAFQASPVQRRVAIKIIKPGMNSKEVTARFNAERQALALMEHPNIAKVFDGGTTSRGLPYFVLELVRGIPITQFCSQSKLDLTKRLSLFLEACKAIQHAHQKGIIHRDIKPNNILVTLVDGTPCVKVIDFGVAKALNQRLTDMTVHTTATMMIGTPAYMSPEQAECTGIDVDYRSDIFSLGATLYELVTGVAPFTSQRFSQASLDEIRSIIRDEEPQKPSVRILEQDSAAIANMNMVDGPASRKALSQLVCKDLDWVVLKAMAKDRMQRYGSASELADDIQRYLDGAPVRARPPSWSYLASRFVKRHRGLVLATSSVLVTLLVGCVASILLALWALSERTDAQQQKLAAQQQQQLAERKTLEANDSAVRAGQAETKAIENLLESRIAFAELNVWSGKIGQQHDSLKTIAEAVQLAQRTDRLSENIVQLRSQAIAALTRVDLRLQQSIPTSDYAAWHCGVSRDLKTIAYPFREGSQTEVRVGNTQQDMNEFQQVPVPFDTSTSFHDYMTMNMSPQGRYFVSQNGNRRLIWDIQQKSQIEISDSSRYFLNCVFSPDDNFVCAIEIYPDRVARAHLYSLPSGKQVRIFDSPARGCGQFSPDGRMIALGESGSVAVHDVESGELIAKLKPNAGELSAIAWSSSGGILATAVEKEIWIWDLSLWIQQYKTKKASKSEEESMTFWGLGASVPAEPSRILRGHESVVDSLDFHPQYEHLLASSSWDASTRLWNAFSESQLLFVNGFWPKFSHDGKRICVSRDSKLEIYELQAGEACRWVMAERNTDVVIDHESRWLAIGSVISPPRFLALPSLKPLMRPPILRSDSLTWDASSSSLLYGSLMGVFRFPAEVSNSSKLNFGPGKQLCASVGQPFEYVRCSSDGRWLLAKNNDGGVPVLVDLSTGVVRQLNTARRVNQMTISPNGRWYALGFVDRVDVFDTYTSRRLARLKIPNQAGIVFSPDGRTLVLTPEGEAHVVETDSWKLRTKIPGTAMIAHAAFSEDSSTVIIPLEMYGLGIFNVADGQTLGTLNCAALPRRFFASQQSQDSRFFAISDLTNATTIWDMELIRGRLAKLGIDWKESPVRSKDALSTIVENVTFDMGDLATAIELRAVTAPLAPDQQLERLNQQLNDGIELADALALRAQAHRQLGNNVAAAADWEQAVKRAPYVVNWKWDSAYTHLALGNIQGCWQVLNEIPSRDANAWHHEAMYRKCRLAATHPELITDEAAWRQELTEWLDTIEGRAGASNLEDRQWVVSSAGEPHNGNLKEAIGLAYLGLGDLEKAQSLLESRQSDYAPVLAARALICVKQNQREQAEKLYQASVANRKSLGTQNPFEMHLIDHMDRLAKQALETLTGDHSEP